MSKMGDWVLEMQEDCVYMDRGPWAEKHGHNYLYIYDEFLGIVPSKFADEPRSCNENTRTSKNNRKKQVPYSRTPLLRVRNAKGNGGGRSSVHRTSTWNVYTVNIYRPVR